MKQIKYLLTFLLISMLAACGKSYEGLYESALDPIFRVKTQVFLGDDSYVEAMGARVYCDALIERESNNELYLTCDTPGENASFKVIDEDTVSWNGNILKRVIKETP